MTKGLEHLKSCSLTALTVDPGSQVGPQLGSTYVWLCIWLLLSQHGVRVL